MTRNRMDEAGLDIKLGAEMTLFVIYNSGNAMFYYTIFIFISRDYLPLAKAGPWLERNAYKMHCMDYDIFTCRNCSSKLCKYQQ